MTPTKLTPLFAVTERLGAQFVDLAGWRFPGAYAAPQEEIDAVRAGCGLADVTPHGKIQIEGMEAAAVLKDAFGAVPEAIGGHASVETGHLYRLRNDVFYLSTPPGQETAALDRLQAARGGRFVALTDLTHGLADIRLIGPKAPLVLSKLCGLDFHPQAFPDLSARQTSLARTRQLILRRDFGQPPNSLPAYTLIGARSLAAFVWEALMEAGREFGLRPVGVTALRELEG